MRKSSISTFMSEVDGSDEFWSITDKEKKKGKVLSITWDIMAKDTGEIESIADLT